MANGVLGRIAHGDESTRNRQERKQQRNGRIKFIEVKARSFAEVLDTNCAPRVMDFLSLDVEGNELRVMKSFPFERYQFNIMLIEETGEPLRRLLYKNGYKHITSLKPRRDLTVDQLWMHISFFTNLSVHERYNLKQFHEPGIPRSRWRPRCVAPVD